MKISARNVLRGKVVDLILGQVAAEVKVDIGGTIITSTITVDAARDLGLAVGDQVSAIVKASDVLIGK